MLRLHCFRHSDKIQQANLKSSAAKHGQRASVFDWEKCQVEEKLGVFGTRRQHVLKQEKMKSTKCTRTKQ